MRTLSMLAAIAALAACGAPDATDLLCADTAVLTWDNFGQSFLVTNCQGCHARAAAERHGAPAAVVFDTRDDALGIADRILVRTGGDPPTMPPGGGISPEDRRRLVAWLTCFEVSSQARSSIGDGRPKHRSEGRGHWWPQPPPPGGGGGGEGG